MIEIRANLNDRIKMSNIIGEGVLECLEISHTRGRAAMAEFMELLEVSPYMPKTEQGRDSNNTIHFTIIDPNDGEELSVYGWATRLLAGHYG